MDWKRRVALGLSLAALAGCENSSQETVKQRQTAEQAQAAAARKTAALAAKAQEDQRDENFTKCLFSHGAPIPDLATSSFGLRLADPFANRWIVRQSTEQGGDIIVQSYNLEKNTVTAFVQTASFPQLAKPTAPVDPAVPLYRAMQICAPLHTPKND